MFYIFSEKLIGVHKVECDQFENLDVLQVDQYQKVKDDKSAPIQVEIQTW